MLPTLAVDFSPDRGDDRRGAAAMAAAFAFLGKGRWGVVATKAAGWWVSLAAASLLLPPRPPSPPPPPPPLLPPPSHWSRPAVELRRYLLSPAYFPPDAANSYIKCVLHSRRSPLVAKFSIVSWPLQVEHLEHALWYSLSAMLWRGRVKTEGFGPSQKERCEGGMQDNQRGRGGRGGKCRPCHDRRKAPPSARTIVRGSRGALLITACFCPCTRVRPPYVLTEPPCKPHSPELHVVRVDRLVTCGAPGPTTATKQHAARHGLATLRRATCVGSLN